MQPNNRDIASVWDMTQAIRRIQEFSRGFTFNEYLNDIHCRKKMSHESNLQNGALRLRLTAPYSRLWKKRS